MEETAEKIEQAIDTANSGAENRAEQTQNAPAGENTTEPSPKAEPAKEPDYKAEAERYKAEAERGRHAMARARKERAAEKAEWERRFSELEGRLTPKKQKTREDFGSDAEWQEYALGEFSERVAAKVRQQIEEERKSKEGDSSKLDELKAEVTKFAGPETDKVWDVLEDRYSEAGEVLTDPNAKTLLAEVMASRSRGALLTILARKPQIFRDLIGLTPTRQAIAVANLERAVDEAVAKAKKGGAEAAKRSESLPAVGSFGTNGRGSTDISGLTQQQRLDRYKAEALKRRI